MLEHHCRACYGSIHSKAKLCPHCGTEQQTSPWLSLANVLKWVAASTAVISLLLTLNKVNGLLDEQQQRQHAVAAYIAAGKLELRHHDYRGAWQHYQQALQLAPGHEAANQARLQLAMQWLRHLSIRQGETFESLIAPIIPALYEGIGDAKGAEQATILAHIGWAHYLRFRENRIANPQQVNALFESALQQDADNPWAHVMFGFWQLYHGEALTTALHHIEQAETTQEDRQEVLNLALAALLQEQDVRAKQMALRIAHHIAQQFQQQWQGKTARRIARLYTSTVWYAEAFQELTHTMPATQHLDLWQSLNLPTKGENALVLLRLRQQNDQPKQAQAIIQAMKQQQPPYNSRIMDTLNTIEASMK